MNSQNSAYISSFERHSWTPIEFEAINLFIETLPQACIRSHLLKAFDSITTNYTAVSNSREFQLGYLNGTISDTNIIPADRAIGATIATSASQSCQDLEVSRPSPATIVEQFPNSPPLSENELSILGTSMNTTMPNESLSEDEQAADIISSIQRNSQALQSYQNLPASEEARDLSPLSPPDPAVRTNQEVSAPRSCPPNTTTRDVLHCSTQAVGEPGVVLDSLQPYRASLASVGETSSEWAQPPVDFTRLVSRQEDAVFELANPLSSCQPASYEDLLDWGTALRSFTVEDPIKANDDLPGLVPNPFPPCDSINALASLEWDLLSSAGRLTFGADGAIIDSGSN